MNTVSLRYGAQYWEQGLAMTNNPPPKKLKIFGPRLVLPKIFRPGAKIRPVPATLAATE